MTREKLHDRLSRMHRHLPNPATRQQVNKPPCYYDDLAASLGGSVVEKQGGAYCLIKKRWSSEELACRYRASLGTGGGSYNLAAFSAEEKPGQVDAQSLLFFDTETTGLGGSGAVAFLVGCGSIVDGQVEVRQYLIPDYSDETAMLEALLDEFTPDRTLVSFNGAAFDLPLLRTRMIMNRVAREIGFMNHIDLLHPSRRIFRRRLRDCSLTNLEQELLGFVRGNDVPGYLIPSIYFDWLNERKSDGLQSVLEHNQLDIVSLVYLLGYLSQIYDSKGDLLDEVDDLHSLSRLFGRRKEQQTVRSICDRITDVGRGSLPSDIELFHSMNLKRTGNTSKAVPSWIELAAGNSREGYLASLELAKYYEHTVKDYDLARRYALRAGKLSPGTKGAGIEITRRLSRLARRLKSS